MSNALVDALARNALQWHYVFHRGRHAGTVRSCGSYSMAKQIITQVVGCECDQQTTAIGSINFFMPADVADKSGPVATLIPPGQVGEQLQRSAQ